MTDLFDALLIGRDTNALSHTSTTKPEASILPRAVHDSFDDGVSVHIPDTLEFAQHPHVDPFDPAPSHAPPPPPPPSTSSPFSVLPAQPQWNPTSFQNNLPTNLNVLPQYSHETNTPSNTNTNITTPTKTTTNDIPNPTTPPSTTATTTTSPPSFLPPSSSCSPSPPPPPPITTTTTTTTTTASTATTIPPPIYSPPPHPSLHSNPRPQPTSAAAVASVMQPSAKSILERRARAMAEGRRQDAKLTEAERRIVRRLRNRESAERCRLRRIEQARVLERRIFTIKEENDRLVAQAEKYRLTIQYYQNVIDEYTRKGSPPPPPPPPHLQPLPPQNLGGALGSTPTPTPTPTQMMPVHNDAHTFHSVTPHWHTDSYCESVPLH